MNEIPTYSSFQFYFVLLYFAYIGIYIFLGIRKLKAFRAQVVNHEVVNWYYRILLAYITFLALHLIYYLIQPLGEFSFAPFNQLSLVLMTLLIQSIAFKLINSTSVFNAKIPEIGDPENRIKHEQLIINSLEKDQIFKREDLNLNTFSKYINLNPTYVSELINQRFNCSFKKLINQYRIEESKKIMKETKKSEVKLIDIAFEVGFNNKVSFYRSFKEFENTSPSEYFNQL